MSYPRDKLLDRVRKEVLFKHGSLELPDFHFRWEALDKRPYRRFVDEALTHFFMKDSTDLNQDGSFVYAIRSEFGVWKLQLSMVGPYGVLFRIREGYPYLLEANNQGITPEELLIIELIRKHELCLLEETILFEPIGLKLDYTDPENVRIYQALFSDTDTLPWKPHLVNGPEGSVNK